MKIRTVASILILAILVSGLSASISLAEEAGPSKKTSGRFLSDTAFAFPDRADDGRPISIGSASAHGNNQTRIVSTETSVYVTVPLQEGEAAGQTTVAIGLWHLNDKGEVDMAQILTDSALGVSAGTTSNIMADADGNIWVVCPYTTESFCHLLTWMYDPATGETVDCSDSVFFNRGGNYGKPNTIVDAENGKLYAVIVGGEGQKSGHLGWFVFDIAARTWSEFHYRKIGCCAYYHYGYADGRGGFVSVCQNIRTSSSALTDIPGMNWKTAVETFHSSKEDSNFHGEAVNMIYVPNADVNEAVQWTVMSPEYDVENGLYPGVANAYNDLYFDRETGYLYIISTLSDSGAPGDVKHLLVLDTNRPCEDMETDGVYPVIVHRTVEFLYGFSETYTQHICRDTEGNFFIVAVASRTGRAEIWSASDPLFGEIRLAGVEDFRGAIDRDGGQSYGLIAATGRNNSVEDDKAEFLIWSEKFSKWVFFSVDLEAVRAACIGIW